MNQLPGRVFCSSSGQPYAYITETNRIVRIDRGWYETLDAADREQTVLRDLRDSGLFTGELPQALTLPMSMEAYRSAVAGGIRTLTLEITQRCTLRCGYCIYSGNYAHARTHRDLDMSVQTVRQSIDCFAAHNAQAKEAVISLYGGEALLAFDTVRFAVAYARERIMGKPLSFRLSTNGTTLTPDVIAWLEENPDVGLTVTVNGYAHDRYRVFPGGQGSLEVIMRTLRAIRAEHPEIWARISFIANAASARELLEVRRYYMEEIGRPPVLISGISAYGANDYIEDLIRRREEDAPARAEAERLYAQEQDPYLNGYFQLNLDDVLLRPMTRRGDRAVHASCCMPFTSSLFVAADGTLGLCEKTAPRRAFGTAQTGIDMAYAEGMLGRLEHMLQGACRACWAERLCDICWQSTDDDGVQCRVPEAICAGARESITQMLRLFADIAEQDPQRLHQMRGEAAERAARAAERA